MCFYVLKQCYFIFSVTESINLSVNFGSIWYYLPQFGKIISDQLNFCIYFPMQFSFT